MDEKVYNSKYFQCLVKNAGQPAFFRGSSILKLVTSTFWYHTSSFGAAQSSLGDQPLKPSKAYGLGPGVTLISPISMRQYTSVVFHTNGR
jgi:hypothetical protein